MKSFLSREGGRRARALIIKEGYQILRDPSTLLIVVLLPLILLFLYGYGVSLDLNHLKIGIVVEENTPVTESLVKAFTDSAYFDVKVVRDRREFTHDITSGAIRGFLVIPSYFTDFFYHPTQTSPLQAIADGSETNTANFFQSYVRSTINNWIKQEGLSWNLSGLPQITIQQRVWYNEPLESRYFLLSGAIAIIMTLIGTLLTALVVSREWERGTMEALISTPVEVKELILGKMVPYFILGMISMVMCVTVSVFLFGVPYRGTLLPLFLSSSAFLISALGAGLLISTLSRSQALSYQIAVVTAFLPAYILSGFLFEIHSMPHWIQWLSYLIPARYFVQNLQTLFLVGDVWGLILKNIAFMLFMGALLFAMTWKKMKKRLD